MAPARLAFLERVCYISNSASLPLSLSADSFVDEFSTVFFPVIDDDNTSASRTHRNPSSFVRAARVSTAAVHPTWVTLCPLSLFLISFSTLSKPYFIDPADRTYTPQEDLTRHLDGKVNTEAPESARKSVLLMALATLGFMFADVAAKGVAVGFSQRQERDARERVQNLLYATRTVFQTIAQLILAIGLNSPAYGGDFSFELSFSTVMLILAIAYAVVMPITWYLKGSQFVRFEVTNTLLIMYAMKLLSLVLLPCLPAQELKRQGGSSPFIGAVAVLCFVAALIWSMMTSIRAL